MAVYRGRVLLLFAACTMALPALADEIRLRDGKKLYGTIVGYEDNMFRVKTDFGFILVEKDKIASIIPSGPEGAPPSGASAGAETKPPEKTPAASTSGTKATVAVRFPPSLSVPRKPAIAEKNAKTETLPALTFSPVLAAQPVTAAPLAASATPEAPQPPPEGEEIKGNEYINNTYGFRMYKAPGWDLIENAREALPDAIVAMGTSDEATLLIIGRDPLQGPLETSATAMERRLEGIYENYRQLDKKKTQVAGLPAVEYQYRGVADGHDWSGRLVAIARGNEVFSVLGMTYADSDLIQIQENVISRAIASLDFSAP
jgi:hypothetical protein